MASSDRAGCIRSIASMTRTKNGEFFYNSAEFGSGDALRKALDDPDATPSPKVKALIDKIRELDNGGQGKHVVVSSQAEMARLAASALIAALGMRRAATAAEAQLRESEYNNVLHLRNGSGNVGSFVSIFNDPRNSGGQLIRIMVVDEGTLRRNVQRLDDVRYLHFLEPPRSQRDFEELTGLATQKCAHRGVEFNTTQGYKLDVFVYDVQLPGAISSEFGGARTLGELAKRYDPASEQGKDLFLQQFRQATKDGALDYAYTRKLYEHDPRNPPAVGGGSRSRRASAAKARKPEKRQRHRGGDDEPVPATRAPGAPRAPGIMGISPAVAAAASGPQRGPQRGNAAAASGSSSGSSMVRMDDELRVTDRTRALLKKYFTPASAQRGMVLWHSAGTGKACTAISIASESFIKDHYDVLWITRDAGGKARLQTLRQNRICNEAAAAANAGQGQQGRGWLEPRTFQEFSSFAQAAGRGGSDPDRLRADLIGRAPSRNEDILYKVLVVVEDAHLLLSTGLHRTLSDMLRRSYQQSGQRSARVLLLTDEKFIHQPLDLIQLVNMCKNIDEELVPNSRDDFARRFLDPSGSTFTPQGRTEYLDLIAGYISHVDRSFDISVFAVPRLYHVFARISESKPGTMQRAERITQAITDVGAMTKKELEVHGVVVRQLERDRDLLRSQKLKIEAEQDIDNENKIHKIYKDELDKAAALLIDLRQKNRALIEGDESQYARLTKCVPNARAKAAAASTQQRNARNNASARQQPLPPPQLNSGAAASGGLKGFMSKFNRLIGRGRT